MNTPSNQDPRLDNAAATDETVLAQHEKAIGKQPDDKGHYRLTPLVMLFVFAGFVFFGATYLVRYSGHFDPRIFNETQKEIGSATAAVVDPVVMGQKFYNAGACNTCHQATGVGVPGAIPPLIKSEWVMSEERAIRIVLHGLQGPITVNGQNYNSVMPAFGKVAGGGFNWSDERIAHVLTYVRQAWGNSAPPVTKEKVAEIHAKEGDRKPWTAAELEKFP